MCLRSTLQLHMLLLLLLHCMRCLSIACGPTRPLAHRWLDDVSRQVPLLLSHRAQHRLYLLPQAPPLLLQHLAAQALQALGVQPQPRQGAAHATQGGTQLRQRKGTELSAGGAKSVGDRAGGLEGWPWQAG